MRSHVAQKVFALIFREESRASYEMRVGNQIRFCQKTTRLGMGRDDLEIFGTRQKRGFTKGRSWVVRWAFGIWFFKLALVKSLLGADPDSVRPVVA